MIHSRRPSWKYTVQVYNKAEPSQILDFNLLNFPLPPLSLKLKTKQLRQKNYGYSNLILMHNTSKLFLMNLSRLQMLLFWLRSSRADSVPLTEQEEEAAT